MQQIELTRQTRGTIFLFSIISIALAFAIFYQVFISKKTFEIEVKKYNSNKQLLIQLENNLLLKDSATYGNLIIKKPTTYQRFVCDTSRFNPINLSICLIVFLCFLFLEIKLYKKGLYNVDVSKYIATLGYIVMIASLIYALQSYAIQTYVFDNTKDFDPLYKPINFYFFWITFMLLMWLSKFYKKAFELKQEQDLTI